MHGLFKQSNAVRVCFLATTANSFFQSETMPKAAFPFPYFTGWAGRATGRRTGRLPPRPGTPAAGLRRTVPQGPAGQRGDERASRTGRRPRGQPTRDLTRKCGCGRGTESTPHLLFPTPDRASLTSGGGLVSAHGFMGDVV